MLDLNLVCIGLLRCRKKVQNEFKGQDHIENRSDQQIYFMGQCSVIKHSMNLLFCVTMDLYGVNIHKNCYMTLAKVKVVFLKGQTWKYIGLNFANCQLYNIKDKHSWEHAQELGFLCLAINLSVDPNSPWVSKPDTACRYHSEAPRFMLFPWKVYFRGSFFSRIAVSWLQGVVAINVQSKVKVMAKPFHHECQWIEYISENELALTFTLQYSLDILLFRYQSLKNSR